MNHEELIDFAVRSAKEAFDQRAAYDDPVGSYRDNVIDTLNEYNAPWHVVRDALDAFNAEALRMFGNIVRAE